MVAPHEAAGFQLHYATPQGAARRERRGLCDREVAPPHMPPPPCTTKKASSPARQALEQRHQRLATGDLGLQGRGLGGAGTWSEAH